jgi:3-oxoacyl-[acyl-carrier protein] reductase
MKDLSNKIAIVTGANRGIGLSIVNDFLSNNIEHVIAISKNIENLESCSSIDKLFNDKVTIIKCDISNLNNLTTIFSDIKSKFSKIDILVNNAGIASKTFFCDTTLENLHNIMDVNFYGAYNFINFVIPIMINNNYGKIVNISSTSSFGSKYDSAYACSKAALDALTKSVAKEVASFNITINSILPSMIDTDLLKDIPEETLQNIISSSPMKRLGRPEEVSSVVTFLCSDASSYITGENIIVSGGIQTKSTF